MDNALKNYNHGVVIFFEELVVKLLNEVYPHHCFFTPIKMPVFGLPSRSSHPLLLILSSTDRLHLWFLQLSTKASSTITAAGNKRSELEKFKTTLCKTSRYARLSGWILSFSKRILTKSSWGNRSMITSNFRCLVINSCKIYKGLQILQSKC